MIKNSKAVQPRKDCVKIFRICLRKDFSAFLTHRVRKKVRKKHENVFRIPPLDKGREREWGGEEFRKEDSKGDVRGEQRDRHVSRTEWDSHIELLPGRMVFVPR